LHDIFYKVTDSSDKREEALSSLALVSRRFHANSVGPSAPIALRGMPKTTWKKLEDAIQKRDEKALLLWIEQHPKFLNVSVPSYYDVSLPFMPKKIVMLRVTPLQWLLNQGNSGTWGKNSSKSRSEAITNLVSEMLKSGAQVGEAELLETVNHINRIPKGVWKDLAKQAQKQKNNPLTNNETQKKLLKNAKHGRKFQIYRHPGLEDVIASLKKSGFQAKAEHFWILLRYAHPSEKTISFNSLQKGVVSFESLQSLYDCRSSALQPDAILPIIEENIKIYDEQPGQTSTDYEAYSHKNVLDHFKQYLQELIP
jgi:hypothetical protein